MSYGFLDYVGGRLKEPTDAGSIRATFGRYRVMRPRGTPGRSPSFPRRQSADKVAAVKAAQARRIRDRARWTSRARRLVQPTTCVPTPRAVSRERSRLMASVRQRGTAPELIVRRVARTAGLVLR